MSEALIFDLLARPGSGVTIHNVRLLDVQPTDDGFELLTIEHAATTRQVVGSGRWSEQHSRRYVGRIGYVEPAPRWFDVERPHGACYFRDYADQSLRRVPELDSSDHGSDGERAVTVTGWSCDSYPNGFRAPAGVIPGEHGQFVPDETVAVSVRVPPEFVRECRRVQMTPEEVLCSFVGDLAGIRNSLACPRADGFGSNGSDERDFAERWLERAHGMNAVDLDELENSECEAEEKQDLRDDFVALMDAFESSGGNAEELFVTVEAIVAKQEKSAQENDGSDDAQEKAES